MKIIDTHAHLYLDPFDNDINDVINRAVDTGVNKILLPNIDSSSVVKMNHLCELFPGICYPMIGLHPTSVKENSAIEFLKISSEIQKNHSKYIAIGEIGLDLYWDKTYIDQQKVIFMSQLEMGVKYNLPVVIHVRNSFDEVFQVIDSFKGNLPKGVFHCFSGNYDQAKRAINYGFLLGIGGVLTYKNSGLSEIICNTDISNLLLETDAPFLAPVPYRGKRNESSLIKYVLEKISEIKNISVYEVAEQTTQNACSLFRIE